MGVSKIMIVDDETGIRDLLSEALLEKGFHVTSARDGRESLKYMRKNDFDLLITDINMPHINGFELLRKMKTAGRKEKIVIMTGEYLDLSDMAEDMPFVYFQLRKPFKLDEFLQVVSTVLKSGRRNRRSQAIRKTGKKDGKCSIN